MKKFLLGLVACLFALGNTGCSAIDSALDDYLNYSTVAIEYAYDMNHYVEYKDFKVVVSDVEYNAVGSYKVPVGTVINLSWSYNQLNNGWRTVSESVSVATNGKMTISIAAHEVYITVDELF